jgi:hypothetical protein
MTEYKRPTGIQWEFDNGIEELYTSYIYGHPLEHLATSAYRLNYDKRTQEVIKVLQTISTLPNMNVMHTRVSDYICAIKQNKIQYTGDHGDDCDCKEINQIMLQLFDQYYKPPQPSSLLELIISQQWNDITKAKGVFPEEIYEMASRQDKDRDVDIIEMEAW